MSETFDRQTGEIIPANPVGPIGQKDMRAPARYESAQTGNFADALSAAQGEMEAPKRTKTGTVKGTARSGQSYDYSYKYAPFEEVVRVIRGPLAKHGIAWHQGIVSRGELYFVRTFLRHKGTGEFVSSDFPVVIDRAGPQGLSSAITYAKRYGLSLILGVAAEDDDDGAVAQDADTPNVRASATDDFVKQQQDATKATRAHPAKREQTLKQDRINAAAKLLQADIDKAQDWIGLRGIYDEQAGTWNKLYQDELAVLRKEAPDTIRLLHERIQRRLAELKKPPAPANGKDKEATSDVRAGFAGPAPDPTPEQMARLKQLAEGVGADQIAEQQKAEHRKMLLRLAREAALTAGRQGLRAYARHLSDTDYEKATSEWEDIREEVMATLLPIADAFDNKTLTKEQAAESEKLQRATQDSRDAASEQRDLI